MRQRLSLETLEDKILLTSAPTLPWTLPPQWQLPTNPAEIQAAQSDPPLATVSTTGTVTNRLASLDIEFSQPMEYTAFRGDSYLLTRTDANGVSSEVTVSRVLRLSDSATRLIFATPLNTGNYTLDIAEGVANLALQSVANPEHAFTVAIPVNTPDVQAPTATVSLTGSAPYGTTGFDVTFSEPMGSSFADATNYQLTLAGAPVSGLTIATVNDRTVRINGSAALASGSYELTLIHGNLKDLAGNALGGTAAFGFTVATPDVVLPTPTASLELPTNPDQPIASFVVKYNQPMAESAFIADNYGLRINKNPGIGTPITITNVEKIDDRTARIVLANALSPTLYFFVVGIAVTNPAGDGVPEGYFDFTVNPTTTPGDTTAPTVSLADAGVHAALVEAADLSFSEPMSEETFLASNYELRTSAGTVLPIQEVLKLSNRTVRIRPATPLNSGDYELRILAGAKDAAGNALTGNATFPISVRISPPPDTSAPLANVAFLTAADGAVTGAQVTYSEAMASIAYDPSCYTCVDAANQPLSIAEIVRASDTSVQLKFAQPVADGAVRLTIAHETADVAGNTLGGNRDFSFTVVPVDIIAPTATLTTPLDVDAPLSSVEIEFSEAMSSLALNAGSYEIRDGAGAVIPLSGAESVSARGVKLNFANPVTETNSLTLLLSDALADAAGNVLSGAKSWTISVTLQDVIAPTAQLGVPSTVAGPLTRIAVNFSEPMAENLLTSDSFEIRNGMGSILPLASVTATGNQRAELTLAAPVNSGLILVLLSPGLEDLAGNALGGTRAFPVNVSADAQTGDTTKPTASLSATGSVNDFFRSVDVTYSEPMNGAAFDLASYDLRLASGASVSIARAVKLTDQSVRLEFDADLANGNYELRLGAGVTDPAGNALESTSPLVFSVFRQTDGMSVRWVGSDGAAWENPANWSTGTLPGPNDDVVITGYNTPITIKHNSGDTVVHAIQSDQRLEITGGTLTVSGTSGLGGLKLAPGTALRVTGQGASLQVTGAAEFAGASVTALDGAVVRLPGVTQLAASASMDQRTIVRADGPGSVIAFENLTNIVGSRYLLSGIRMQALNGGVLDLQNVRDVEVPAGFVGLSGVEFVSNGAGSIVDLGGLQRFWDGNGASSISLIESTGGGTLYLADTQTQLSAVRVHVGSGSAIMAGTVSLSDGAILEGAGTVLADVINGGLVRPGGAAESGRLVIQGAYNQLNTGVLELDFTGAGTEPGADYDQLQVAGSVSLDGALLGMVSDQFTLNGGNALPVLAFSGGRTGQFASVNGFGNATLELSLSYDARGDAVVFENIASSPSQSNAIMNANVAETPQPITAAGISSTANAVKAQQLAPWVDLSGETIPMPPSRRVLGSVIPGQDADA